MYEFDDTSTTALAFPLALIELESLDAKTITDAVLRALKDHGFNEDYLVKNLIGVCSDGASTMLGRKSGVLPRLQTLYPKVLLWHCMCHRVELAVDDSIKSVTAINHVKAFMDELYSLYSQSPSLQRELCTIASDLNTEIMKIGKVLTSDGQLPHFAQSMQYG